MEWGILCNDGANPLAKKIDKIFFYSWPLLMTDPSQASPGATPNNSSNKSKPRIQTQIHRRQKAKAIPPMKDEWDSDSPTPPKLRTHESHMKKNQSPDS